LACPSLIAHSSVGDDGERGIMAGISDEGIRWLGRRWNEDVDGLVERGGEGMGVWFPLVKGSLASATDGDCSGDCRLTCFVLADASIMRGGSNGVVAKPSSRSPTSRLARSMSSGIVCSSLPPYTLLVGVGGVWICSNSTPPTGLAKFETDDERLDGVLLSLIASDFSEAELTPLRNLNLREKEGKRVPNLVVRLLNVDSLLRRFLGRGDVENSLSLKNPSAKS